MECNRDEALRAKTLAEQKLEKKDLIGAKKFALKAQTLFPELEGISQMVATIEVYTSAENKINGEVDCYGVLGVNPSADDEAIKKHYRKMALMLHPDKNKSFGADGAFALIKDAFGVLSDKEKRLAYNQRRSFRGFHQTVSLHSSRGPSAPPSNGNRIHTTTKPPKPAQNKSTKVRGPPKATNQRTDSFWTICPRCKMHFEYHNIYLNRALLCLKCELPFLASQTPPPLNLHSKIKIVQNNTLPRMQQQSSSSNHVRAASTTSQNGSEEFLKKRRVDDVSSSGSHFGVNSNMGSRNGTAV